MNVFTWLLMGHFLGDWFLQNDWMARGKRQRLFTLAGLTHFVIYTAATVGGLWFSGLADKDPAFYLSLSVAIFVTHWLIDATNTVENWMLFYRQSKIEMVRVMVDQTLHLLVLVWLTVFFLG